jgi:hypothetical protein
MSPRSSLLPHNSRDMHIAALQSKIDRLERELADLDAPNRERNFRITGCATVVAVGLALYIVSDKLGLEDILLYILWCILFPSVCASDASGILVVEIAD